MDSIDPEVVRDDGELSLADTAKRLREWHLSHRRDYPWRNRRSDVFPLAVAEILLQKTKATDAQEIWLRVLDRYPTKTALAKAPLHEVTEVVRKLGLGYQRAGRLVSMARHLTDGRRLKDAPGLGPYGKGIIALTLRGEIPEPVPVDGNIARVVSRYLDLRFEKGEPRKKPEVQTAVRDLITSCQSWERADLIYALVDLGESNCRPGVPRCACCPLLARCNSRFAMLARDDR